MEYATSAAKINSGRKQSAKLTIVQKLADTPLDSRERFQSRALLPGMAKRLRLVGPAVGVVIEEVLGQSDQDVLPEGYGGKANKTTAAEQVYNTIGNTITLSGRCERANTPTTG